MNAALPAVEPAANAQVTGRRVTGLAGIAHALADSLPAGAEVRVEWLQPTLGPGVDASAPSAQSEAVLEDR